MRCGLSYFPGPSKGASEKEGNPFRGKKSKSWQYECISGRMGVVVG